MNKEIVSTKNAPAAIGPYSQAIKLGEFIFTSGQIPINPVKGEMETEIKAATKQVIQNIKGILEEAGSSLDKIIKTTIFLKDMNDFAAMNEVYSQYFGDKAPARSCVQAAKLPKDAVVEIEAIAVL